MLRARSGRRPYRAGGVGADRSPPLCEDRSNVLPGPENVRSRLDGPLTSVGFMIRPPANFRLLREFSATVCHLTSGRIVMLFDFCAPHADRTVQGLLWRRCCLYFFFRGTKTERGGPFVLLVFSGGGDTGSPDIPLYTLDPRPCAGTRGARTRTRTRKVARQKAVNGIGHGLLIFSRKRRNHATGGTHRGAGA